MRKNIVAGNWKMNKTFQEAEDLLDTIIEMIDKSEDDTDTEVIVCPPSVFLELGVDKAYEGHFRVGAQNISNFESGAYTGEIAAPMLKSMEVDFCIIGHSERRKYFNETHKQLAEKVKLALKHDITPIFCCGELLPEREAGSHFDIVKNQIGDSVFVLSEEDFSKLIIAYEPVWAIGTGVTATSEQAQEMHAFIRKLIKGKYGEEIAENTTILYGGSCNAKNAEDLFSNPDVDGGLIGGASLIAEDFVKIVNSF